MTNLQEAFNALTTAVAALPASRWNKAKQDERDAMVRPVVKKWYAEWRDKMTRGEFNEFKDVWLVRENFHTSSKMLDTIEREEKGILTLAHLAEFSHDEEYVQDLMDVEDCDRDTALMYEAQDFETEVHETCKDLYHDITSRNYANMRIVPEWNCHNPDSELVLGFFPDKGWRGDDKLLDKVISMLSEYVMRPVGHDGKVITDYDEAVKFVKDALKA